MGIFMFNTANITTNFELKRMYVVFNIEIKYY